MKAKDRFTSPVRWLTGVLLGLLLCGPLCWAQAPALRAKAVVSDVVAQGNRLVPTQRIMSVIKTRPGNEYQQEVVNEDIRRLYETKQFGNINVQVEDKSDGTVKVFFVFVEYPSVVQEIVYNGAKHLKPDELNTLIGLRKGSPLNPIANKMACQAITRRYNEEGRPFASCYLEEGDKPGDTRVVFNITEGPQVKVSDIDFTGNTFVEGAVLRTHLNSSRQWFHLFGGKFNPMVADLDVSKLEEYYHAFGFHDVRVSRELRYDASGRYVVLVFHIQEGQRYNFGGVVVEGNKKFSREELERLTKVRAGEPYNQHKVDVDKKVIEDYYGYTGVNPVVRAELFYPPNDPGVCQVQYQVQERPEARVGEIRIIGNTTTRQDVILRQVPIYPGQILSYPDMRVGEKNLARLGIFESNPESGIRPTITVLDPDTPSPFKDILITVNEQPTGSLVFGVGVNSDAGLTGSVVLNERNFDITRPPTSFEDLVSGHAFRGGGQEFRAEAMPGTEVQRYSLSFREPSLFDSPYSLSTGAYYSTRIYDEYDETRLGSRITVGRRLSQYWTANVGIRAEDVGVHNIYPFAPIDFQEVRGDNFLVALRGGVVRDSRDSYLRPTEGSILDISYEQTTGDFTYPVFNIEFNKYWTAYQRADGSGRHVLAFHTQFGLAGANTPVYDRFYAGGFRSIRGFQLRGVGPDINGFKVGGDFLYLNSLEYQIPLTANEQVSVVGFVDSGTVERRLELRDYRVSAGFGFRFTVPLLGPVPIALDFGFPIVKGPADREQIFSFWLGFFR